MMRDRVFREYAEDLFTYMISNYRVEKTVSKDVIILRRDRSAPSRYLWEDIRHGNGSVQFNRRFVPEKGHATFDIGVLEDDSVRPYFLLHPGSGSTRWNFLTKVPDSGDAALKISYGFVWGANKTDGAIFSIDIDGRRIFSNFKRYDGYIARFSCDLSEYRGREIMVSLVVDPSGTNSYDWTVWNLENKPAIELSRLVQIQSPTFSFIDTVNDAIVSEQTSPIVIDLEKEKTITISGWALDREANDVGSEVFITIDGRVDIPANYGIDRSDVSDHFENPRFRFSGYMATFSSSIIERGMHTLSVKIVTKDGRGYYYIDQKVVFLAM